MAKHAGVGTQIDSQSLVGDPDRESAHRPKHAALAGHHISMAVVLAVVAVLVVGTVVIVRTVSPVPDQASAESLSAAGGRVDSGGTSDPVLVAATPNPPQQAETGVTQTSVGGSLPLAFSSARPATFPETGPGLTQPGILLFASPLSDGSFDVIERVRLERPVDVLALRPAPVAEAGRQFASASAVATQVQISAGDQPVLVPQARVDGPISLAVPQVDQFELRYLLTDITVRSTPSTAGRAIAALGPLTDGVDDELPVLLVASGGTILGLNCPLLALSQQSCGSHRQTSMQSQQPRHLAMMSVQFDLPAG